MNPESQKKIVKTYDYTDKLGNLLFQVVRAGLIICDTLAQRIIELIKPLLSANGRHDAITDVIFDVPALAEYLKVFLKWVYERTHLKEIPHIKTGGLLRFKKKDIDKWLNTYHVPALMPKRYLRAIK